MNAKTVLLFVIEGFFLVLRVWLLITVIMERPVSFILCLAFCDLLSVTCYLWLDIWIFYLKLAITCKNSFLSIVVVRLIIFFVGGLYTYTWKHYSKSLASFLGYSKQLTKTYKRGNEPILKKDLITFRYNVHWVLVVSVCSIC